MTQSHNPDESGDPAAKSGGSNNEEAGPATSGPASSAASSEQPKQSWKSKFRVPLVFCALILTALLGLFAWNSSPFLRAAVGPMFYANNPASLSVEQNSNIITTAEKVVLKLNGRGANQYSIKIFKFDQSTFGLEPNEVLQYKISPFPNLELPQLFALKTPPLWQEQRALRYTDFSQFESLVELPKGLDPGDYVYTVSVNGTNLNEPTQNLAAGYFRVSDISFIFKKAPDRILLRAFNALTMKAIEDANVTVFGDGSEGLKELGHLKTNKDGIGSIRIVPPRSEQDLEENPHLEVQSILVEHGNHRASMSNQQYSPSWNSSSSGDSSIQSVYANPRLTDVIFDKTVYRLGQTVQFKGFSRRVRSSGGYFPPIGGEQVSMEIRDVDGNQVQISTAVSGPAADFEGSFKIPDDGKTGPYSLVVKFGDREEFNDSFQVMQYRKPEYEVSIAPEKSFFLAGEKVKAKLTAKYFFGGPVANAQVHYQIERNPDYSIRDTLFDRSQASEFFGISSADRYQRSSYYVGDSSFQSESLSFSGETNEKGELEIEIDTKPLSRNNPFDGNHQALNYRIAATVTDLSRKAVVTDGSALVTPGMFAISLDTSNYVVRPDSDVLAKIKARNYDLSELGKRDVEFTLENWIFKNEKWSSTVLAKATGSTDDSGNAQTLLKAPSKIDEGELVLCARSHDDKGREIADYSCLWLEGYAQAPEFKLDLDKASYEPEDTIKAIVTVPPELSTKKLIGLASIDGTTVFDYKLLDQSNVKSSIEFRAKEHYGPRNKLRVTLIDEEHNEYTQEAALLIYPRSSLLKVAVKANKEVFEPGQTAELLVDARSYDGKPASNTPLVLSLVDESVYAVMPDSKPDIEHFFYGERPEWTTTNVACRPLNKLELFPVPFFFPYGNGTTAQGVLMEKSMPRAGPAGGATEGFADGISAKMAAPTPTNAPMPSAATIGSKIDSKPSINLRSNFQDTAFFSGALKTDAQGQARIKVKLPDNLTTWRATSSLLSNTSEAGSAKSKIMTSREIVARLALPRFFTQDDKGVITAIVHNHSKLRKDVELELQVPAQFKLAMNNKQKLSVEADDAGRVTWPVEVIGDGKVKITLFARTGTGGDALVQELNILPHSFPAFAYKNGVLKEGNEKIDIPLKLFPDARPGSGKFSIALASSGIGPVLGNFDKLIDYPYGCTEQTMSRMMPSVVAMQLHRNLQLPLDPLTKDLFVRVYHKSIAKLAQHMNGEGGWGWWQGDQSNTYLTAYVMEGLYLLKTSGFSVDQSMIDSGKEWLQRKLDEVRLLPSTPEEMTDLSYAFYALSLHKGRADFFTHSANMAIQLKSGPDALSYLTLAYANMGQNDRAEKAYAALKEISNQSWEYVNWEHTPELMKKMGLSLPYDYSYRFTPAESTALAFRAVIRMEPKNEKLTSSIRRWILLQHDENGWSNSKTTSQVFLALLDDELKDGRNRVSNFKATASIGSKSLASYLFNQQNRYSTENILKLNLVGDEQALTLTKSGPGKLYYNSLLEYKRRIVKGKNLVPRSSPPDLVVERDFYKLVKMKEKDGSVHTKGLPVGAEDIRAGDTILMKVKIKSPFAVPYIKVEAPLPSGAEVISDQGQIETVNPEMNGEAPSYDDAQINYWWTHQDILDDRIVFFVTQMAAGQAQFQALLRMEMPGELNANPVTFEGMYTKAIRGYSSGAELKIVESEGKTP